MSDSGITTRFGHKDKQSVLLSTTVEKTNTVQEIKDKVWPFEERFLDLGSGTNFVVDWDKADVFRVTPLGIFSIAFSNTPKTGVTRKIVIEVVNGVIGALTIPADGTWGSLGAPTFSANIDLVSVLMRNGDSKSFWMLSFPG